MNCEPCHEIEQIETPATHTVTNLGRPATPWEHRTEQVCPRHAAKAREFAEHGTNYQITKN